MPVGLRPPRRSPASRASRPARRRRRRGRSRRAGDRGRYREAPLEPVGPGAEELEPKRLASRPRCLARRPSPDPIRRPRDRGRVSATRRLPTRMITPDQRATLQLLLERGQSYADLAALLGQDEADVRARARAALTELGGADPDRTSGSPTTCSARPIRSAAPTPRATCASTRPTTSCNGLAERLRLMFPTAELPAAARRAAPERWRTRGAHRRLPRATALRARCRLAGPERVTDPAVLIARARAAAVVIVLGDHRRLRRWRRRRAPRRRADDHDGGPPRTSSFSRSRSSRSAAGTRTGRRPSVSQRATSRSSTSTSRPRSRPRRPDLRRLADAHRGAGLSAVADRGHQNGSFQNRFAIPAAVFRSSPGSSFVDVSIAPVKTIERAGPRRDRRHRAGPRGAGRGGPARRDPEGA